MIDERKDDVQSSEELDLGYDNISEIGDDNYTQVDDSLNQSYFKPLTEEDSEEEVEESDVEEDSEAEVEESDVEEDSEEEVEESDVEEDSEEKVEESDVEEDSEEEVEESDVEEDSEAEVEESEEVSGGVSEESEDEGLDEYGEAVQVFATSPSASGVSQLTLNDPRKPKDKPFKSSGSVSNFGETKGGVALRVSKASTVELGRYEFQGTARPSLIFTGDILNAQITVTAIDKFENGNITLSTSGSAVVSGSLSKFLINAANEKIDEINGVKYTDSNVKNSIDDRLYLTLALSAIFAANNTATTGDQKDSNGKTIRPLELTFKELDSITPKQTTLKFKSEYIFKTSVDLVKNIVNVDSLINNGSNNKNNRDISKIDFRADGIAVNIDFKVKDPKNGLKTNTRYEFIAPNKELMFFPVADSSLSVAKSTVGYVEGFTMGTLKTGKRPPLFEVYEVKSSNSNITISTTLSYISLVSAFSSSGAASTSLTTNIDFYSIDDTTFIDYDNLVSVTASNATLDVRGTSIEFKTLKIFDKDETISKVEIEDDRLNKYPVTLAPIDENNSSSGAYPKVTGLQRSTPYIFRKLHITAKPENEDITKTFHLVTLSGLPSNSSGVTAVAHNISIRTATFTEPKLFIELDPEKAFVSTTNGSFSSTSTKSEVAVYIPKLDVELPNKIKMPAVKNDKTSLRYVIEVEKSDVTIKDLTVNGLNGSETFKIERIEGKTRVYFILTLLNLSEKRDYGFLILELSYLDLDGRELITRQVLNGINKITNLAIGSSPSTTIKQYPDESLDNTTGPELTGKDIFNVTLFEATNLEARQADIPVFIDDINSRFLRLQFAKPETNPEVEVTIEDSTLKFRNLKPKTDVVYKLDFVWENNKGSEEVLSKYAKISTPAIPSVDVKDAKITTTSTTAEIVFELHSVPKTPITTVTLSDSKIKFTWNKDTLTLKLEGLKPETEYKDLVVNFKVESGLITKYKLKTFKTVNTTPEPTGAVAEFVSRVYEASLGRKPEVEGWRFWTQKLESKEISVLQFMSDLFTQDEFVNKFLSKAEFVKMMYMIVVGREAEEEGKKYWEGKYDEYKLQEQSLIELRRRIAFEMMNEQEFKDYVNKIGLRY